MSNFKKRKAFVLEVALWWERQTPNKETNNSSQILVCSMKNTI